MTLHQIKHCVTGKVLFEQNCNSLRECVVAAVKARAYLAGANLAGADLAGADLARANLAGVHDVIPLGQPNGWHAFAWHRDGVMQVRVGCRSKTLAEGRDYWAGKDNRREVLAALDYAEAVAKLRAWPLSSPKSEAA